MNKRYPRTILTTACVPWDESFQFEELKFRNQVRHFIEKGIRHLYLFGTAGEGYAVTDEQYKRIVEVFAEEMRGPELHPMVGIIHMSLPVMLQRIETGYKLGIRDFQISLPSWGALADDELYAFFHAVCDAFPDCRFMHYNLLRTKRLVTPAEYVRLAEEIPNLVGAKFTTVDMMMIHKLMSLQSPLQFFFGELGFGYGSMVGECGLLTSLANSNLERAWQFFDAAVAGEKDKIVAFHEELYPMLNELFKITGAARMDGAYDKLFYKLIDPEFPMRLLPPYQTFSDESAVRYRQFLQSHAPQWLGV